MPRHTNQPIADTDDNPPRDFGDLLMRLHRRMATSEPGRWKACDSPHCRRERRCIDAALRCVDRTPRPPMTAEEDAAMRAELQQMLRARQPG